MRDLNKTNSFFFICICKGFDKKKEEDEALLHEEWQGLHELA
jgi:hypothetical protein